MSSELVSYKIGFMFPGQGAQTVGMAGALCEEYPEAKELFTKVRYDGDVVCTQFDQALSADDIHISSSFISH